MNTEYMICYGFTFNVYVYSKNGKKYTKHNVSAIGLTYSLALWDMENKLKRRGMQLNHINNVTVERIEFALDEKGCPVILPLSENMPIIPDNFDNNSIQGDP
ncbi:hypothetical protein [Mucilaginibacter sp.]